MSRPCTVCRHPQLAEIDLALAYARVHDLRNLAHVARTAGLSLHAVRRHFHRHLPAELVDQVQAEAELVDQAVRRCLVDHEDPFQLMGEFLLEGNFRLWVRALLRIVDATVHEFYQQNPELVEQNFHENL